MSVQPLMPFKAKFTLNVSTTIKTFFKDSDSINLSEKLTTVTDENKIVNISAFIKYYQAGFKLYDAYKHLHFKYHQPDEVSPESISSTFGDCRLSFKLQSFEIEVLQIVDKKITFANNNKEIHTVELNEDLILVKI